MKQIGTSHCLTLLMQTAPLLLSDLKWCCLGPLVPHSVLSFHLTRNRSTISKDLLHNLYVDNVVSGCHSEEGAIEYFIKSRSLLNDAKFNLCSWASNSLHLRNTAKEHKVDETDNPAWHVVGHSV